MPIYTYRCDDCGLNAEDFRPSPNPSPPPCPRCSGELRRRFGTFGINMGMEAHFNVAAGRFVTNEAKLKDAFAEKSDEATERTGIEHRFVPIDPRDKEECGVTDEGLEDTYRRAHDEGRGSRTLWL